MEIIGEASPMTDTARISDAPVKKIIRCPECNEMHIDVGEWQYKLHHKHLCHYCFHIWRIEPYVFGLGLGQDLVRAFGFDAGCQYSNKQIAALKAENEELHAEQLEALLMSGNQAMTIKKYMAENERLREAGESVIKEMFETYTAKNGQIVGVQDQSGEKCMIVPHEAIDALKAALKGGTE